MKIALLILVFCLPLRTHAELPPMDSITVVERQKANDDLKRRLGQTSTVFGFFRKNEGCIEGFKRIGISVTLTQCLKMAEEAKIESLWYNPSLSKSVKIIIPVREGARFGYVQKDGVKLLFLSRK